MKRKIKKKNLHLFEGWDIKGWDISGHDLDSESPVISKEKKRKEKK
jgi:hypothetical protein